MQDKAIIMLVGVIFSLLWLLGLFCIIKPEPAVNFAARFFKWQMKLYGFKAEIEATPRARMVCRAWNMFMFLFLSLLLFLIFSGKLK